MEALNVCQVSPVEAVDADRLVTTQNLMQTQKAVWCDLFDLLPVWLKRLVQMVMNPPKQLTAADDDFVFHIFLFAHFVRWTCVGSLQQWDEDERKIASEENRHLRSRDQSNFASIVVIDQLRPATMFFRALFSPNHTRRI